MDSDSVLFSIFLIFTGASLLATVALYARQALLIAYIIVGLALGPWGLKLVTDASLIQDMARVGIIFLLFLLGLNLYPQKLLQLLRETTLITVVSSLGFAALGFVIALLAGLKTTDALVVGVANMFSSTILGLKLLPTTVLHHRHAGEVIISVLLLQDVLAILVLLALHGVQKGQFHILDMAAPFVALPALATFAYVAARFVLLRLFQKFDRIQEYIFLVAIGWCLGIGVLAEVVGLSHEIGAFVAGVAIATNPIARFIAESLKPLRDFFLVMFFFALGAGFDLSVLPSIIFPALLLTVGVLALKPIIFKLLLVRTHETERFSWEIGFRLGQMSEFSLLIALVALDAELIADNAAYLIQAATLLTFIGSSYLIVLRYPTPIAVSDRLRRD
ncbi:MAG: cation:proton antiporter [Gammaproteobacteria bacterium]|nr:cation:proton antiporter [Gammaproteobacteria bacterium]